MSYECPTVIWSRRKREGNEEYEEIAKGSTWDNGPSTNGKGYRAWKGDKEIRYNMNGTRFDAAHFYGEPYWIVSSSKGGKVKVAMTLF